MSDARDPTRRNMLKGAAAAAALALLPEAEAAPPIRPLTQEQIALAHRHAQAEGNGDVEATLSTLEAEPVYYFYPAGRKFTGMANTRRFYEGFVRHFKPRIRNVVFHGEAIGNDGLFQEYTIAVECDDGVVRDYRILGILMFGKTALTGERMYADEALFRLLASGMWDEMERI